MQTQSIKANLAVCLLQQGQINSRSSGACESTRMLFWGRSLNRGAAMGLVAVTAALSSTLQSACKCVGGGGGASRKRKSQVHNHGEQENCRSGNCSGSQSLHSYCLHLYTANQQHAVTLSTYRSLMGTVVAALSLLAQGASLEASTATAIRYVLQLFTILPGMLGLDLKLFLPSLSTRVKPAR